MSPPRQSKPNVVIADAEYMKAMSGAKRALYLAGFMDCVWPVKGLVLPDRQRLQKSSRRCGED